MKKNLLKDISASTVQILLNYVCGFLIFFITSRYLSKSEFGELNWSLALLVFITAILSLRLEQVVVRRVASGEDASLLLSIFTAHLLAGGLIFYTILFAGSLLFPDFFERHHLLLLLAISHLLSFFSSPFKQVANGKEKFALLAVMSVAANLTRAFWLLFVIFFSTLTIQQVLVIYIVSSLAELLVCMAIVRFRMHIAFNTHWRFGEYLKIMKESLPQMGTVFFNAGIARIDWILLGFFSNPVIIAEYSFAYRLFELCPLPLLILSPILLSRFSKFFSQKNEMALLEKDAELDILVRWQIIIPCIIFIITNITWVPFAENISGSKYGEANRYIFLVLSCCLPLQFLINLSWTIHFSLNQLLPILKITAITFVVMFILIIVLIPLYGGIGAALGYAVAQLTEYVCYLGLSKTRRIRQSWIQLLTCFSGAVISYLLVENMPLPVSLQLVIALVIFTAWVMTGRLLKSNDLYFIKQIIKA